MACTTFALGNVLQAELDPAHRGGQRGNDSRGVAFRDPDTGRQVFEAAVAPDLIVGYAPGCRASWQTNLGATPAPELEDNTDAWIADHCINPVDPPASGCDGDGAWRISVMRGFGGRAKGPLHMVQGCKPNGLHYICVSHYGATNRRFAVARVTLRRGESSGAEPHTKGVGRSCLKYDL